MSLIGNMPAADVHVTLPSGNIIIVNMIVLLGETLNAEMKAKHKMFLPGVNKLNPTVKGIRDKYEIPEAACRTWADAARLLRKFYNDLSAEIRNQRGI